MIKVEVDPCQVEKVKLTMSDGKRRKDNNRAALYKCWTEDIEWELIPNTLREVSAGNGKGGGTFSVSCAFLIMYSVPARILYSWLL